MLEDSVFGSRSLLATLFGSIQAIIKQRFIQKLFLTNLIKQFKYIILVVSIL